ncbi:2Fe-2S ferredoxin [Labrenzia sp. EL_195]|nr:2Fe-2S ferredoxin [Labrenzia sp. EL_195]
MIRFVFVQPDGSEVPVSATEGDSIMKVAIDNGVDGIRADCNGSAACATCHAFFAQELLCELTPMHEHENDLLDFAATDRQPGSRLSCQVTVSRCLEGQKVKLPDTQ